MGMTNLERAAGDYVQCQRWLEIHQNWRSQQPRPFVERLIGYIGKRMGAEFPEPDDPELENLLEAKEQASAALEEAILENNGIHLLENAVYIDNGPYSRIKPVFVTTFSTGFKPSDENSRIWSPVDFRSLNRTAELEIGRHDVLGYQTREHDSPRVLVPTSVNLRIPVTTLQGLTYGFVQTVEADFKRGKLNRQTISIQEAGNMTSFACVPVSRRVN